MFWLGTCGKPKLGDENQVCQPSHPFFVCRVHDWNLLSRISIVCCFYWLPDQQPLQRFLSSYRGFEVKQPLLHSVHGWNHVGTSVPSCYHCYQRALHPVWNAMRILKIPHQTQTWNIFIPAVLSNGFPGRVAHWINHKASVDLCCPSGRAWVVKVSEQWVFGAVPVPAGGCCWFHAMSCGWSSLKTTLWNTDEYGWIWQEHANICKLSNKWRCWRELGRLTAIHTILHPDVSHPWFSIPSVEES